MWHEVIVIGGSAGSMAALAELLPMLPASYPIPIVIVQHLHPLQDAYHLERYASLCDLRVKEADEKEPLLPGWVYLAPPNYHLLMEDNRTFSLSVDEKVNYARPSIDVLFESAADVYRSRAVGVILTGANNDGAYGLSIIKQNGGLAIVQDPQTAEKPFMPQAAIKKTQVDHILPIRGIGKLLFDITLNNR